MLCSPDAPFSSRGPQSPHLQLGRASGPYHSDVDSTPLRASCGVRTGDLLCSQNKHYHNPRKPFWYLSVPLGVRDNGVPGLGDCPLVKRHVREGLGIPAEAGPCSPPGASVGRGHGDHSIIPSAGLVPSPVSGTGGAGSQPQSHLWGSPQMGWRGGREASGNTDPNKHHAGSGWKASVGSGGFQPAWEGRSSPRPWYRWAVEGGRQPRKRSWVCGEARVEGVGRKMLAAPVRKLGRKGAQILEVEWTDFSDDWVGVRDEGEGKMNEGQFVGFSIGP